MGRPQQGDQEHEKFRSGLVVREVKKVGEPFPKTQIIFGYASSGGIESALLNHDIKAQEQTRKSIQNGFNMF